MMLDQNAPTLETLNARVRYDPETGNFFAKKNGGRRRIGDRLGYPDSLGYWKIFLGGWIMAHRAAWFITHGEWPEGEIDHINGNPGDNRICNLRVASRSQNVANAKVNPRNTSGFRGVTRRKRYNAPATYQASIRVGGKQHYIGVFKTPEEAHAAYLEAGKLLHGEFFPMDADNVHVAKPAPTKPTQGALI